MSAKGMFRARASGCVCISIRCALGVHVAENCFSQVSLKFKFQCVSNAKVALLISTTFSSFVKG